MTAWQIEDPRVIEFEEVVEELRVSLVAGDVTVAAGDGPGRLEVRQVTGKPLEVQLKDGRLEVRQEQPRIGLQALLDRRSASITLNLPARCRSQLKGVSASVLVGAMAGDLEVETVSGDVTLESLQGRVEVESVSGTVTGRGLTRAFNGETVSGEVILEAFSGPELRLETVSGDLSADLQDSDPGGSGRVTTVSGSVYLRLPASASQKVDVETVSGRLTSAFGELSNRGGWGSRTLEGTLGEGRGSLKVETVSGSVSLLAGDDS